MATKKPDTELMAAVQAGLSVTSAQIDGIVPGFDYAPSDEMRALKARFWRQYKADPSVDESDVTPAYVSQVLKRDLKGYLSHPGFWAWFANMQVTETLIEMAAERAAETALRMLDPSWPLNDNARVQLIKYVLEFSGRSPVQRRDVKWMDRDVAELTEDQLDALIAKQLARKAAKPTP